VCRQGRTFIATVIHPLHTRLPSEESEADASNDNQHTHKHTSTLPPFRMLGCARFSIAQPRRTQVRAQTASRQSHPMDKNHHTEEDIASSRRAKVHPVVRKRKSEQSNGSEELQPLKPPHFHHTFFLFSFLVGRCNNVHGVSWGGKRKRKGSANKKHKHSLTHIHTHNTMDTLPPLHIAFALAE